MRVNRHPWLILFLILVIGTSGQSRSFACPFCSAVGQTLRQEMATMDLVVIAQSIKGEMADPDTGRLRMRVVSVLQGHDYVKLDTIVTPVYYGNVDAERRFLLFGVEPANPQWSSMPITQRGEAYVNHMHQLPDDPAARLRFVMNYLEDEEAMLARDAYDEFAVTPYEYVTAIKEDMDRDQLLKWLQDPDMPADRKRLYFTMLGVCGSQEELPLLETLIRRGAKEGGLDALIACYLTLAGESGLPLINELFLENKKAPYTETYSAIMAIRFHGTETDIIPRSALLPSLYYILERPELADLVISDLSRWGDWTKIDQLTRMFIDATEENNFVRVPIINYLRACPKPEASQALEKLTEVDPESVRRSNIFFAKPVVQPDPAEKSSSSLDREKRKEEKRKALEATREDDQAGLLGIVPVASRLARSSSANAPNQDSFALADARPRTAFAALPPANQQAANRFAIFNVMVLMLGTLLISAWLILTSGTPALQTVESWSGTSRKQDSHQ